MVQAWPFEQLLEVVRSTLHGLSTSPMVDGSYEQALMPLLVLLLDGMVGGAFTSVLIPLRLAFEAIEDCSDRLLARGVPSANVEELLGSSRALAS